VITTDNVGTTFTSATTANVRVDNTAPSGSVTAPAPSATIKGTFIVTSDSADAGSGVANALFQRSPAGANTWTNVAAADATSPYTASWVTAGDGLYDLQVITTDKSGNTSTSALIANVRVDNTAPTGAVTAPAASANVRGPVAITSNSADAGSGVASALFQSTPHGAATWTSVAAAATTSPYTATWDTTAAVDGLYDLRVITTDTIGNTFTSATIANVRVDNTAPTGAITAPAASAAIRGTFTLTANSADAGSGVANALFQRSPPVR
jgi:chitinase